MADRHLVVATLNLFNNPHGRWPERAPLVAAQLAGLAPDVIALQEVDARSPQIDALVVAVNERVEGEYRAVTMPNPDTRSIKSLAVLTRLPATGCTTLERLGRRDIALRVVVDAGGWELDVVTTHLHYGPTKEGSRIRRAQAEQLIAWVDEQCAGRPHVVVGDFNAPHDGSTAALLKQRWRSAHEVVHGQEPELTHPTPLVRSLDPKLAFGVDSLPWMPAAIDYVFVSDGLDVLDARLAFAEPADGDPDLYPSDHYGLTATIARSASHTGS